jgi:ribonuclease P protein component
MSKTLKFESLRGNLEFKKILSSKKVNSDLFTIYYANNEITPETNKIHMSFVSAKKLGNAVKRNRIRRRLRMAARRAITEIDSFNNKYKYAVFAKSKIYDVDFNKIVQELGYKFSSLK